MPVYAEGRVEHQKRTQTATTLWPFGFVFGVQLGSLEKGKRGVPGTCRAASSKEILLLDFENAFNLVDRALLLEFAVALVPEAAKVLWWLYENETILMNHSGGNVTCSTRVLQGCPLTAIAFGLVVKWLVYQLNHSGLEQKQFYMKDGLLYGTPQAMKWTLDPIRKLEPVSGLKLKYSKMSVHTPNAALALEYNGPPPTPPYFPKSDHLDRFFYQD